MLLTSTTEIFIGFRILDLAAPTIKRLSYIKYIDFPKTEGYLLDDVEELEVEDLQGIQGLRALRVSINFSQIAHGQKDNEYLDHVLNKSKKLLSKKKDHLESEVQRLNELAVGLSENVSTHNKS